MRKNGLWTDEYTKTYNRKNAQEWRLAHPDERYVNNKKWAEENPNKVVQSQEKYIMLHSDRVKESKRAWKRSHPEYLQADKEKRRAMQMHAPGDGCTSEQWKEIMQSYSWRCVYCGKVGGHLTMDHIVPLISGGSQHSSNIVPACRDCKCKKNQ